MEHRQPNSFDKHVMNGTKVKSHFSLLSAVMCSMSHSHGLDNKLRADDIKVFTPKRNYQQTFVIEWKPRELRNLY